MYQFCVSEHELVILKIRNFHFINSLENKSWLNCLLYGMSVCENNEFNVELVLEVGVSFLPSAGI